MVPERLAHYRTVEKLIIETFPAHLHLDLRDLVSGDAQPSKVLQNQLRVGRFVLAVDLAFLLGDVAANPRLTSAMDPCNTSCSTDAPASRSFR